MATGMQPRLVMLLGSGFAASAMALLGVFGTYHAWEGQFAGERVLTIFLFPITATVIALLLTSLLERHVAAGGNGEASAAAQGIVFWIAAFLVGVNFLMLAVMVGIQPVWPWAQRGVIVLLGLTLIAVGNLLPRTRPNLALGVRTARTLTDRQLWILTHRLSGYITVVIGIVTVLSGAFVSGTSVAAAPLLGLLAGAVVVSGYYWRLSRA